MADSHGRLSGREILIVDDEPLLAHDLADHVQSCGATVVGPFHTLADAFGATAVRDRPADCALLDIEIGRDLVWPLADALRAKGISIVFISAHCGTDAVDQRFRDIPCLSKPVDHSRLDLLISRLVDPI